jgi:hypothetical protein
VVVVDATSSLIVPASGSKTAYCPDIMQHSNGIRASKITSRHDLVLTLVVHGARIVAIKISATLVRL